MKNIFMFLFILIIFVEPLPNVPVVKTPITSVVIIEDGVIYGNVLPRYGVIDEAIEVRGAPNKDAIILRHLSPGDTVRLRDKSRGSVQGWVMIADSEWIPMHAVYGMTGGE